MKAEQVCVCKSGQKYQDCCQIFHNFKSKASTCEQLMRSRYSAFICQNEGYLLATYHPDFCKKRTIASLLEPSSAWVNLEIIAATTSGDTGFVEFKAWYFKDEKLCCHHELSRFINNDEQWFYCDGEFYPIDLTKLKRNSPCPCGSAKKYKKCCL